MKRTVVLILMMMFFSFMLSGCRENTMLDKDEPVTLTMWHVYGEQADSPMNELVDTFNRTIGMEKGIIIDVTMISNSSEIGQMLLDAQNKSPGAGEMPDLFFCHTNNAAALGQENLIDWSDLFSEKELDGFVEEFVAEGMIGNQLTVFPISKSTHLLFVNGTEFERFSKSTGVTYEDLASWDGFFDAAAAYYDWSGGKAFCAFDYLLRSVELNAQSEGAAVTIEDGWYDCTSETLQDSWMKFAIPLAEGGIIVSDLYANTQVMTGEVAAGISSSAAVLYYNDTVTYSDNTTEPLKLEILPMPQNDKGDALATQAGVGLCACRTTEQKTEAISIFTHWFTESDRNLDFVAGTGYMPVTKEGFDSISQYEFKQDSYEKLYDALQQTAEHCTMVREPADAGYYNKVNALYDGIRQHQLQYENRRNDGESAEAMAAETWQLFRSVQ